MGQPETRYARNGDTCIAYQVTGQGSLDLMVVAGFPSNLEVLWEDPGYRHFVRRLSSFGRVILFDRRGSGLSDRTELSAASGIDATIADALAVLDACGSGRAAVLGLSDGVATALALAAAKPARVRGMVLYGGYARPGRWARALAQPGSVATLAENWGSGERLERVAPSRADDPHFHAWWARLERLSASPSGAVAMMRANAAVDVRGRLGSVTVPTLVVHRADDGWVNAGGSRDIAAGIAGARLVELAGRDHPIYVGDIDRAVDVIEEFLTGEAPRAESRRVLAALLAVRIVGPQRAGPGRGDRDWLERAEQCRDAAGAAIERLGGRVLGTDPMAFIARFDVPSLAARAAIAVRQVGDGLRLRLAQGLNVGEVELDDDARAGMTFVVAQRIAEHAEAGAILAASLVADLAIATGTHFAEASSLTVDGLEHPVRLVSIVTVQHLEPAQRGAAGSDLGRLSGREHRVLGLIATGLSNAAIAAALGLSEHTVKRHVANILLKLELPSRSAAAAIAAKQP